MPEAGAVGVGCRDDPIRQPFSHPVGDNRFPVQAVQAFVRARPEPALAVLLDELNPLAGERGWIGGIVAEVREAAPLTVELIQPIAMEKTLRFAIREGGRTVGAGRVSEIIQ